jgi:hypothetical protein
MKVYVCCCYENRKGEVGQWGTSPKPPLPTRTTASLRRQPGTLRWLCGTRYGERWGGRHREEKACKQAAFFV